MRRVARLVLPARLRAVLLLRMVIVSHWPFLFHWLFLRIEICKINRIDNSWPHPCV